MAFFLGLTASIAVASVIFFAVKRKDRHYVRVAIVVIATLIVLFWSLGVSSFVVTTYSFALGVLFTLHRQFKNTTN